MQVVIEFLKRTGEDARATKKTGEPFPTRLFA
jgi:hypothetical protein